MRVDDAPILHFKSAAETFCESIEAATEPRAEFLAEIAATLSSLYRAALDLPDVWDDDWKFQGEYPPSRPAEKRLTGQLKQVLGDADLYVTVVAYGEHQGEEIGMSMLSDDLLDIYVEVFVGLELLRRGSTPGEAAWTWRFGFWGHWGEHAVDALRIIHALVAEDIGGTTVIAGGGH
jgi:hypothetical protein